MPSSFPLVAMSIMIIQIIYKLNPTLFRFGPCDGFSAVGGGVRKEGFKGGERLKLSFSGFCEIAACVNLGVTLEGLRGVDNAARLLYLVRLMLSLEQC